MGFSVRLAPGVRIRMNSRGVRASIGTRAARIHVGSGRTGFSTGAGPFSFYTSLSGSQSRSRARSSGPTRRSPAATSRALEASARSVAASERLLYIQELVDLVASLTSLHWADFQSSSAPVAPPAQLIDEAAVFLRHRQAALKGVGILAWSRRARAKRDGRESAAREIAAARAAADDVRMAQQEDLDQVWSALGANDPYTVMHVLETAFEDNEAMAVPLSVDGAEAILLVLVPPSTAMPSKLPSVTPGGKPTLKQATKQATATLHKEVVAGFTLVTVKEAFAQVPALQSVRVVAVTRSAPDAYGTISAQVLLAATFERSRLVGVRWRETGAIQIVNEASSELAIRQSGSAQALTPLDLSTEPELDALIKSVDLTEQD